MTKTIRYTLGQLVALNKGETNPPDSTITKLFDSYPYPKGVYGYPNVHNLRFNITRSTSTSSATPQLATSGKYIQKEHIYSDAKIIEDIRAIINTLNKSGEKTESAIERLNQLAMPQTQATEIAVHFHQSIIDCDFLIDEYLKVVARFSVEIAPQIRDELVDLVFKEFSTPTKFEDSRMESATDRMFRWRSMNSLILAKMYNIQFPNSKDLLTTENICTQFLDSIFKHIDYRNPKSTQLLATVWAEIEKGGRLIKEDEDKYDEYVEEIETLIMSPHVKMTEKARLTNIMRGN